VKKLTKALRRLWLLMTCDHRNCCLGFSFGIDEYSPDETCRLSICSRCGHNSHREDDYTTEMGR